MRMIGEFVATVIMRRSAAAYGEDNCVGNAKIVNEGLVEEIREEELWIHGNGFAAGLEMWVDFCSVVQSQYRMAGTSTP